MRHVRQERRREQMRRRKRLSPWRRGVAQGRAGRKTAALRMARRKRSAVQQDLMGIRCCASRAAHRLPSSSISTSSPLSPISIRRLGLPRRGCIRISASCNISCPYRQHISAKTCLPCDQKDQWLGAVVPTARQAPLAQISSEDGFSQVKILRPLEIFGID